MFRRLLIGLFAIGLLLVAAPAFAQPPVTETTHQNRVDTFVDFLPSCEPGASLYTFTTTQKVVVQSTTFDDGHVSGTVIQTGTFTAVPLSDPTLPTYTGKVNLHNTFHVENDAVVQNTFTVAVHGTGSDGSTFEFHSTQHANVTPTGAINEFFRCH
jgi:hypothetical protein